MESTPTPPLILYPLFAEGVQAGFGQILGEHDRMKLYLSVEREEPGLGNRRNLRSAFQMDNQYPAAAATEFRKVGCLRLQIVEDVLHFG